MRETRQLVVRGRYECISSVADFVAQAARDAGLDEDAAFHCQIAVDEACTNVIEHAYGGENRGPMQITCIIEPGRCTTEIVDRGKPFEPNAVPAPKTANNIDDLEPGGIGLHLMRRVMDEVQFKFEGGQNTLTMVKTDGMRDRPLPETPLPVAAHQSGNVIVKPAGRLAAGEAPDLDTTLETLLENGFTRMIVDMKDVSYISSRGLKVLVSTWRKAGDLGGHVLLCCLDDQVASVFDIAGFTHIFALHDTLEDALQASELP